LPTLIVNLPFPIVGAEGRAIETSSLIAVLTCPYLSIVIRGILRVNVLPNSPTNDLFALLVVVIEETLSAIEGPLSA
jgi:hypothetical protein